MRAFLIILAMGLALSACKTENPAPDLGLPGFAPGLFEQRQAECIERGGSWAKGGRSGGFVCFEKTRDAGKSCQKASDCEEVCLARSRSCTPIKPVYGCVDILTQAGTPSTICID